MNRRDFNALTALAAPWAAGSLALAAAPAQAQDGAFAEGRDFVKLGTPVAVAGGGKVEVVEFFWYGCPHCNAFEPMLDAWQKKLPQDVAFRRVPVAFSALHETHARMFYALEALGQVEAMHRRVFAALHIQRRRLDTEKDIAAFMKEQGLDDAKFLEAMKSFGVVSKTRQARTLTDAYKIDGVPALGIQGRYYTSGALAKSNERALQVTEFLIDRVRKGA